VDIVRRVPEDLVAPMDPQRMQEVFLNLFLNAAQPSGTPPDHHRVRRADAEAGQA
jgi:hypothetical protein